jgi:FkbM family methyltransferase
MCGHAFVGTVHDHLNDVEWHLGQVASQLGDLRASADSLAEQQGDLKALADSLAEQQGDLKASADSLAEAEGALLQSGIRTIEGLKDVQAESRRQHAEARQRLDEAEVRWSKLLGAWQSVREQNGHLIETVEDRLAHSHQTLFDAMTQLQDNFSQLQNYLRWVLDNEVPRQVCVETGEYGFTNPETGLFSFLYSHLPDRGALDIGASHGSASEPLLQAGYEVYAFEPQPEVYEKLVGRLGNRDGFHAFPFALGSQETEMPLHLAADLSAGKTYGDASGYGSLTKHSMPADLPFTSARTVMVKTLAGLHNAGTLPQNIGLVKIDTEGYDLEVVRGMGERRYPVVAAEFWDSEIPFGGSGQLYTLKSMVGEMRSCGYLWHIVLYRIWGQNQSGFYCNHDQSIPKTWGNVVFFRDYGIFAQAQSWCSAVLPRTYFKAVAQA